MDSIELVKKLNAFIPFSEGDPTNDNVEYLYNLLNSWHSSEDIDQVIVAIFRLIENYPHADFGSPGPLVHTIEKFEVELYQHELQLSLLRRPAPLTVWMYNRIINSIMSTHLVEAHIERLEDLINHPMVDEMTKDEILNFIDHQRNRLLI